MMMHIKLIMAYALAILMNQTTAEIASQVAEEDLSRAYAQVVQNDMAKDPSFYVSYFQTTDLLSKFSSAQSKIAEEPFRGQWDEAMIQDLYISMYSALPTSRQSSLAVNASEFYDIYTSLDKDASSWESPRLTPVSSSTWITNIPYVTTTGVFSDSYPHFVNR
ncbi:unnamed protein product [Ambrosiozyma monospora]|uniref:Unnamed protein product n=1 Tax=Ambrosiozyma monospora TaxID=43982 RepID=A0ACB5UA02_AMBMO|nr:unnamed protein product [Ambrosiozyma monospora]